MAKISAPFHIFPKSWHFLPIFKKNAGGKSSVMWSPHSSYAPVVIKKYRMLLLTKFTMVKLKIAFFSVSTIFLKSALRWKLSVTCLEECSLHSPA